MYVCMYAKEDYQILIIPKILYKNMQMFIILISAIYYINNLFPQKNTSLLHLSLDLFKNFSFRIYIFFVLELFSVLKFIGKNLKKQENLLTVFYFKFCLSWN